MFKMQGTDNPACSTSVSILCKNRLQADIECTVDLRRTNYIFVTFINLDQRKSLVVQVEFQSTIFGLVVYFPYCSPCFRTELVGRI